MGRQVLFVMVGLVFCSGLAWAEVSIPVENYSFELPGSGKIIGWDIADGARYESGGRAADVPAWDCDGKAVNDSGVETGWTPTDGSYTGFMKATDPDVYNLTSFPIGSGDVFELTVDVRNTWVATSFRFSLYYDDNGKRTTVATSNVAITDTMQPFSLTFTADTVPACYGHEIGIEFDNTSTTSNSWVGFDNVRLKLTGSVYRAMNPYPAHKGFYGGTSATLTWTPGADLPAAPAPTYKVYLHQDQAVVDSNDASAYQGIRDVNNCDVSGIVQGQAYYWRIDTISGANTYRGSTWRFTTMPQTAYNPDPSPGAVKVPVGPVVSGQVSPLLSWQKGTGAVKGHRVYFSDSFDAVNNAAPGSLTSPAFKAYLTNVDDVNWAPSESGLTPLATSKTYYWRIDTVQSTSPQIIYKGTVWSFTTVPIPGLGFVTREVWTGITGTAVADLTENPDYPGNPADTYYPTSFDAPRRWSTDYGTRIHGWLYIEDTNDYTFWLDADDNGELWLNDELIASGGGTGYHQWENAEQSAPIHLEAGNLYYIAALQKQGNDTEDSLAVAWSLSTDANTAELIPGTSLVPFDQYHRVMANSPKPANLATDVQRKAILTWRSGDFAAGHEVYFGTDEQAVSIGGTTSPEYKGQKALGSESYDPGTLASNTTYYWRVDEVNSVNPDGPWKGKVWSFTTGNFIVLDDFEAYDDVCNRIFFAWLGGAADSGSQDPNCLRSPYDGNKTGSAVGNLDKPFAEQTVVHSGRQSMPVWYDNTKSPFYSEMAREWPSAQSWTSEGADTLTVYLRGDVAGFVETGPGAILMNGTGTDIWDTSDQFRFVYKPLKGNGSIVAKVESMTNVNSNAKAGVMIRETLKPESMHAFVDITPGAGVEFIRRVTTVGESTSATQAGLVAPYWVKLTRNGDIFTAQCSADGVTWTSVGTDPATSSVEIPMGQDVYIGLAVTSRTASTAWVCGARFSNVSTTGGVTGAWDKVDVGVAQVAGNLPETFYIAVQDSAGSRKVVIHPDPAVIGTGAWEEWNIPLSELTSAGVNLSAVTKISLGVGNPDTPTAGGTGKLYIDDIRLTRLANP